MRVRSLAVGILAAACFVGCDGTSPADAGLPDGGPFLAPPDIPWLASGLPCPEGWRSVREADVGVCDPYPEGGRASCGAGEAHFPGEPGCRPVGDACPSGPFADGLPAGGVVYVDANAAAGGNGTEAAPYASLSDVSWGTLGAGAVVALARGSYGGGVVLEPGVTLVGACAAETVLPGPSSVLSTPPTVRMTSAGEAAVVRNVTIADAPRLGVLVSDGGSLRLEGVVVERSTGVGVGLTDAGSELVARDVVVREVQAQMDDETGVGFAVMPGTRLEATRVIVEDNRLVGLFAQGPDAEVSLADAVVAGTESTGLSRLFGRGMGLQTGVHLVAERVLIASNRTAGIYLADAETTATLTDVVVRDTAPQEADMEMGRGIEAQRGASVTATRLVIARNHARGVLVSSGARAVLSDAVIVETRERVSNAGAGFGLAVQEGGRLEADRVVVARNLEVSASAVGEGTTLVLRDAIIREGLPSALSGAFGWGLYAELGASVTAERLVVDRARELGVASFGGSTMELSDVSITEVLTSEAPGRELGHGAAALGGGLRMTRFEVREPSTCGLFVAEDPVPIDPGVVNEPALDLRTGVVADAAIGACLQWDGYDVGRLTEDVEYRDNGLNLESTDLPLPQPWVPPSP